jgi:sodium pump decarboxylase gamma subunit
MKLVGDGFVLFVLGQTVVFLFIFLMVGFINLTAAILRRFESGTEGAAETVAEDGEAAEVAAAVAAVQQSRANF